MQLFQAFTRRLRRPGARAHAPAQISRATTRYACKIPGQMMIMERMSTIEGRCIDLSAGGTMFRPRLAYLMYRRDDPVCLMLGDEELFGRIVSTTPMGFGIRFDEPLTEEEMATLIALDGTQVKEAPIHA